MFLCWELLSKSQSVSETCRVVPTPSFFSVGVSISGVDSRHSSSRIKSFHRLEHSLQVLDSTESGSSLLMDLICVDYVSCETAFNTFFLLEVNVYTLGLMIACGNLLETQSSKIHMQSFPLNDRLEEWRLQAGKKDIFGTFLTLWSVYDAPVRLSGLRAHD